MSNAEFHDAWEGFFQAARRARGRVGGRSGDSGLTLAQWHLLSPLVDGPKPVGALAAAAGISGPTATRTLDGLARAGLAERHPSADDRRRVLVELSAAGRRAVAEKTNEVRAARRRVAAALDADERAQAAQLLRRLTDVMDRL